MTANFNSRVTSELTLLNSWQPDKPSMVMEYWSGWFDHWGEKHHTVDSKRKPKHFLEIIVLNSNIEKILSKELKVNSREFYGV